LVVLTPKSLLRHKQVVSSLDELAKGSFQRVIADDLDDPQAVRRVLLCSGKVYHELRERREAFGRRDVAIVRIEQLYPLPDSALEAALALYADGTPAFWVQEEPENMGAWRYWRARFAETLLGRMPFRGVFRPASASPATGSSSSHKLEQGLLLEKAFGDGGGSID
jgi:2-oxoglutarate dehydrogenase E1 component